VCHSDFYDLTTLVWVIAGMSVCFVLNHVIIILPKMKNEGYVISIPLRTDFTVGKLIQFLSAYLRIKVSIYSNSKPVS